MFGDALYLALLDESRPRVTFATGTPISNTMVEMYTMQRFLDPKGLKDRGIEHFDAWAATFGRTHTALELAPDGASYRMHTRVARFQNCYGPEGTWTGGREKAPAAICRKVAEAGCDSLVETRAGVGYRLGPCTPA